MDNKRNENTEEVQPLYTPRPAWQIWAARLGVVIVVVAFILYLIQIAMGGLG